MGLALVTSSVITPTEREMLKCRAYGHRWLDRGWIAMIRNTVRGWEQELVCDRCETVRRDFRAKGTLLLLARSYTYKQEEYPGMVKQVNALHDLVAYDTARKPAPAEEVAEIAEAVAR